MSDFDARSQRPPEAMGGLAKGLAIIEAFSVHKTMTVADAARVSGTTRAAARRCLLTLTELGYVEQVLRDFRPLPRLRLLGGPATPSDQLAYLARPILERARDDLQESVSLAVLDNGRSLFIGRAEAAHILATGVRVGAHLPLYCSATGRVLLSGLPDADILRIVGPAPLERRTARTIVKIPELLKEIRSVEANKYAISDEELEIGLRSLAVPVRGRDGKIVAALSVSAASPRIRVSELRKRFLPILAANADLLSQRLAVL